MAQENDLMTVFTLLSGTSSTLTDSSHERCRDLYGVLYSKALMPNQGRKPYCTNNWPAPLSCLVTCPETPEQLSAWAERHCAEVARDYTRYIEERQQGGARRYFQNKAHALYFLQRVAPTKEVDGTWLEGVDGWQDQRFDGPVSTCFPITVGSRAGP